jgi:hypothetical protein
MTALTERIAAVADKIAADRSPEYRAGWAAGWAVAAEAAAELLDDARMAGAAEMANVAVKHFRERLAAKPESVIAAAIREATAARRTTKRIIREGGQITAIVEETA